MRDIIKPAAILFLICAIVSGALALTQSATKDKIAERASIDEENARKAVLTEAESFNEKNIDEIVTNNPNLAIIKEANAGIRNGDTCGYVFDVVSKGYGGDVKVTVGINKDNKITGVVMGENNETPGLGSKAADDPFKSQFTGITPSEPLKVVKGNKKKPEEIDAVSGATITSRAMVKAVQAAVDMAAELAKKEAGVR